MRLFDKKLPFSKAVALVVFVLTMAAAIPVRTVQLLSSIDYNTGFYVEGDKTALILNSILWIGLLLAAVLLLFGKGEYPDTFRRRNKPLGIVSMAAGLCMIIRMGMLLAEMAPQLGMGVLDWSILFQMILLVLSAISLNSYGLKLLEGNVQKSGYGILMLMPTLWAGTALMITFMEHTTIANISENLFDELALCATTIFLYTFARVCMGYLGAMTETILLLSGMLTAAFSLLSALPRFLLLVAGDIVIKQYISTPDFSVFGMGLFSTAIVLAYLIQRSTRYARKSIAASSRGPEENIVE